VKYIKRFDSRKYVNIDDRFVYGNTGGWTVLLVAVYNNQLSIVKRLIRKGANLDLQNSTGMSAMMYAANYGRTRILKELIKAGADWNVENSFGVGFLNILKRTDAEKDIINEFPEQYKNYLIKKQGNKYNL
jgi:ankyrin repeat protein